MSEKPSASEASAQRLLSGRAWEAHATDLHQFCGRYDIGYVRADAERPFEEIILKAFRQGRFLA